MVNSINADGKLAYSYVRMSTSQQINGHSLARQKKMSLDYATKHGLRLVEDEFHDIGRSGYTGENIESGKFGEFLAAVRAEKIPKGSYFLAESFDRMSRLAPAKALEPFLTMINAGLKVVTLVDQKVWQDPLNPMDLMHSITLMSMAHEESALKSSRGKRNWERKRHELPFRKATKRGPFWLKAWDNKNGHDVIEPWAGIVKAIFADADAGMGTDSIVRRLNGKRIAAPEGGDWQNSTVNRTLKNVAVIGDFQPHKKEKGRLVPEGNVQRGYYPAIVDEDVFLSVQAGRSQRRVSGGGARGHKVTNLFSKLAMCGYCKQPMWSDNKGKGKRGGGIWLCCSSEKRGMHCDNPSRWKYRDFETTFLTFVKQLDLASIIASERYGSERNDLIRSIDAEAGRISQLEAELERNYKTSETMGEFSSEFLAKKIMEAETKLRLARETDVELKEKLNATESSALHYYKNPDEMRELIESIQTNTGDDLFRLRSMVAARLRTLISEIVLLEDGGVGEDRFDIYFRDGGYLSVFINPDDPSKFSQLVRGHGVFMESITPDGEIDQFSPYPDDPEYGQARPDFGAI